MGCGQSALKNKSLEIILSKASKNASLLFSSNANAWKNKVAVFVESIEKAALLASDDGKDLLDGFKTISLTIVELGICSQEFLDCLDKHSAFLDSLTSLQLNHHAALKKAAKLKLETTKNDERPTKGQVSPEINKIKRQIAETFRDAMEREICCWNRLEELQTEIFESFTQVAKAEAALWRRFSYVFQKILDICETHGWIVHFDQNTAQNQPPIKYSKIPDSRNDLRKRFSILSEWLAYMIKSSIAWDEIRHAEQVHISTSYDWITKCHKPHSILHSGEAKELPEDDHALTLLKNWHNILVPNYEVLDSFVLQKSNCTIQNSFASFIRILVNIKTRESEFLVYAKKFDEFKGKLSRGNGIALEENMRKLSHLFQTNTQFRVNSLKNIQSDFWMHFASSLKILSTVYGQLSEFNKVNEIEKVIEDITNSNISWTNSHVLYKGKEAQEKHQSQFMSIMKGQIPQQVLEESEELISLRSKSIPQTESIAFSSSVSGDVTLPLSDWKTSNLSRITEIPLKLESGDLPPIKMTRVLNSELSHNNNDKNLKVLPGVEIFSDSDKYEYFPQNSSVAYPPQTLTEESSKPNINVLESSIVDHTEITKSKKKRDKKGAKKKKSHSKKHAIHSETEKYPDLGDNIIQDSEEYNERKKTRVSISHVEDKFTNEQDILQNNDDSGRETIHPLAARDKWKI